MVRSPSDGARFADLYVELETIGRGSFGEVLKVRRREDDKELVCKVLRYGTMKEKERQLVVSEVNILRGLRHPHIVRYHDRVIDKASAKLYIMMEYCEGGDLGKLIKRKRREHGCIDEPRVWRALAQLLQAFEECHGHREGGELRPILHRDIKPCNIFLDAAGNIKVGDFGLAKELDACDQFATTNVGTPFYMSPELISEKRYNEKSDVWSIGCLVYELCALRPPFEALNVVSLGQKITLGRFARIPQRYSDELHDIIKRMLTLSPTERPSVVQLLEHPRLQRYLATRAPPVAAAERRVSAPSAQPAPSSEALAQAQVPAAQAEQRQKDVEAYIAAKLAELKRREEDLTRRERALEVRDQDVRFREKVVAKWERDLEGRGAAQAQAQLPPRNAAATAAAAQTQSADRRASLGALPPQPLQRPPQHQPPPPHEPGLARASVEASSPTLPAAARLNAAPEMAPPAGERRRSSERFDYAPSSRLEHPPSSRLEHAPSSRHEYVPSSRLDYPSSRRESSGAASSEQLSAQERRAFSRVQSVDEILEAARRVHLKQEPEPAPKVVVSKAGITSADNGSGSDAENVSPKGSNAYGGGNAYGGSTAAGSRDSSGSSSQGSGVAAPQARRTSLGGKADAEVSSWLRRNVAGAKEYAALAPRLPRSTSVSKLYR